MDLSRWGPELNERDGGLRGSEGRGDEERDVDDRTGVEGEVDGYGRRGREVR